MRSTNLLTKAQWQALGYSSFAAEALEGAEISEEAHADMLNDQIIDTILTWHGIIGYTQSILSTVATVYAVKLDDAA